MRSIGYVEHRNRNTEKSIDKRYAKDIEYGPKKIDMQ